MPTQYGFLVNIGRCVQCEACVAACKSTHGLALGVRRRRVITYWHGAFPAVVNRSFTLACQHCERPACVEACPSAALSKRGADGIVVVDRNACAGCLTCATACPYGAIQAAPDGTAEKCDLCLDRLQAGRAPACVETCPADALGCGRVEDLARIGGVQKVAGELGPAFFIIPPRTRWAEDAFRVALGSATLPSETSALTVIVES